MTRQIRYIKNEKRELSSEQQKIANKLKKMKPTDVINLLASNDSDVIEQLEKGTEAYNLWTSTLEDLNVSEAVSTRQILTNIRNLKSYVKNSKSLLPFVDNEDDDRTEKHEPQKTILDNKQVQDLLCETTRSFVRNVKQEFGNILLAFSARLIGLMESLGYDNPARGAFYLVDDNSSTICSAIINAVSEYNEDTPSVSGVQIERNTKDQRTLKSKLGVSTSLIAELMKIFDEEVITNPEDVISADSEANEVVDVASAINLSDLVHVNKTRKDVTKEYCTIYSAFRMNKGGYSSNFNFGMQIIPVSHTSFNVLYYLYLSNSVTKPNGELNCTNWI